MGIGRTLLTVQDSTRAHLCPYFHEMSAYILEFGLLSYKIFCSDLTSAASTAIDPALSMTVSINRLVNSGKYRTLCTLRATKSPRLLKGDKRCLSDSRSASSAPTCSSLPLRVPEYWPPSNKKRATYLSGE